MRSFIMENSYERVDLLWGRGGEAARPTPYKEPEPRLPRSGPASQGMVCVYQGCVSALGKHTDPTRSIKLPAVMSRPVEGGDSPPPHAHRILTHATLHNVRTAKQHLARDGPAFGASVFYQGSVSPLGKHADPTRPNAVPVVMPRPDTARGRVGNALPRPKRPPESTTWNALQCQPR